MTLKQILAAAVFVGCAFGAQAQSDLESQVVPSPEEVKEEAQANTKYLAAEALKKAKAILDAHGEFAPFGAGLFQDGEVNYVWAVKPGESTEGINPVLVLNAVRSALGTQAQNGRILASAVVYQFQKNADGEVQPQVNVELEYLNGYAEVVATEYEQGADGIEYTKSGNRQYSPKVFTDSQNARKSEENSE